MESSQSMYFGWKVYNKPLTNNKSLTNTKPKKWLNSGNETQVCPIKANPWNVAGMIKEESFNYESINLELPWGYHKSKAPYVEKEVNTKKERDGEKSLHDKTTSALAPAMPELNSWTFQYCMCIVRTLGFQTVGVIADLCNVARISSTEHYRPEPGETVSL